jgi:diaminohydroxyphosphoribosylaminopyrimidine deaminase/5-amino-6-(5-phosphoribosylamino)uracil reductase
MEDYNMENKEKLMQRALELALNGSGFVAPNPLVGAVIINNQTNSIIGEGWHKEYGGFHAETNAINNARENGISNFEDTTMIVNLEPCCHIGKQPPCIDTIIDAKIKKVIVGMLDPNPLVAGKGIEILKECGIEVEVGILEADCKWINRYFCHYVTEGMPYCVLKIAQTLDGFIATNNGESKWITCEESRRRTQFMRSEMDAVMIGINTILTDDPLLDTRLLDNIQKRNPKIIILDSKLRTPPNCNVLVQNKKRDVIIIYSDELVDEQGSEAKERIVTLENAGAILFESPMKNGKIHLRKAISRLTVEYCFTSLLVEGGAEVFGSFINSNIVNELQIFVAPTIMGEGKRAISNVTTEKLEEILKYRIMGSFQSGDDEQIIMIK